nr:DoxX family protein [Frankia nepalensis]
MTTPRTSSQTSPRTRPRTTLWHPDLWRLGSGHPGTARTRPARSGRDLGLLLLRATIGVIMFGHGTQKLFGWFGGSGLDGVAASFDRAGFPASRLFAVVAGLTEALGGAGLVLGLLTPLAGAAILGVMINAMAVVWSGSLYGSGGIEYEVVLAMGGAALALTGPGRFSVDHHLPVLREHRLDVGLASIALGLVLAAVVLLIRG